MIDPAQPSSEAALARIQDVHTATRLWHSIAAAANLGVADALAAGPVSATELATRLGTNEDALYRLLRVLAAGGVLVEQDGRRFELTDVGHVLRSDHSTSIRDWVRYMGRSYVHEAWANLDHSIRTGENTFAWLHGEDVWQWRSHEPSERELFDAAMTSLTGTVRGLAAAFDFGRLASLVDVGGGSGRTLASILAAHPGLHGILFDQESVVRAEATQAILAAAGVAERCEIVGGSFFDAVPERAGGYLLKSILHDWEDVDARRILETIHRDAAEDSILLVVERVVGPANADLEGKVSDLNMLARPGGRERSEEEWRALLGSGGFRLDEVRPLPRLNLLIAAPA